MKRKVWFQTSLDWFATRRRLDDPRIVGDMRPSKGRLHFYLKDFKDVTYQITVRGKLGIYYPQGVDYEIYLSKILPFLVKVDGTPAEIIGVITKKDIKSERSVSIEDFEDEVQEWVAVICKKDESEEEIFRGIKRLRILTEKKIKIAHLPEVVPMFAECLENPHVVSNPKIFQELTLALRNILQLEKENKSQESDRIIKKVCDGILNRIIDILKQKPEFPNKYSIEFLAECKKEAVIEVLFWLINKFKHRLDRIQIETIGIALKKLYSEHRQIINQKIRVLNKSEDEDLQKIGTILGEITSWV